MANQDIYLTTPYTARQAEIDRRRKMAQILQQQAMEPIPMPEMPGVRLSPWTALAHTLAGTIRDYTGKRQENKLDVEQRKLNEEFQAERQRKALDMANIVIPGLQNRNVDLGNVPVQTMPYPGSTGAIDMTFGQGRPMSLPPTLAAVQQRTSDVQTLANAAANPDPIQQLLVQAIIGDVFSQKKEQRQAVAEAEQAARQFGFQRELTGMTLAQQLALANRPQPVEISQGAEFGYRYPQTGHIVIEGRTPPAIQYHQPTSAVQEYNFYVDQEKAAGRQPLSFDAYQERDANRRKVQPTAFSIYAGTTPSGAMDTGISDALSRATMNTPPSRRAQVINTVNGMFARGDVDAAKNTIRQAAVESEPVQIRAQIQGRREVLSALSGIRDLLKDVPQNLLVGSAEDIARKLGTSIDTRYVAIGNRLKVLNQSYRRSMTGAQFSIPEAKEYASIFPDYSTTAPVNMAQIDSLIDAFGVNDRTYWENKLGPGWSDAEKSLPIAGPVPPPPPGFRRTQ